jgi:hypothetical protein
MAAAGFDRVRIETVDHTVIDPSVDAFWTKSQRSTAPLVLLRRRLREERWGQLPDDIVARLKDSHGDGPVEERYAAHLGIGSK